MLVSCTLTRCTHTHLTTTSLATTAAQPVNTHVCMRTHTHTHAHTQTHANARARNHKHARTHWTASLPHKGAELLASPGGLQVPVVGMPVVGTDCSTWAPYKCNDELVFYSEATDCKELCPDEPIIMDGNWAPPEPPIIMDGNWAPPTECPEVLCEMFCEDGFQLGADGCEVCSCNQKPRSVCSMDADCAEDSFCSSTTCRPYSVRVCA